MKWKIQLYDSSAGDDLDETSYRVKLEEKKERTRRAIRAAALPRKRAAARRPK